MAARPRPADARRVARGQREGRAGPLTDREGLTADGLLAAGFREFPPRPPLDRWDRGFQLKVADQVGVRYFVQVYFWQFSPHGHPPPHRDGWEAEVVYNDGIAANPGLAAVKVLAYGGVGEWSAEGVVRWAGELWDRLAPCYYERWA